MKAATAKEDALQVIKQTALMAMFSDDELFDLLVLKGGNAMDLIHQTHARASVDLDFSLEDDLDVDDVGPRIERVLRERFADKGYRAFDIQLCP
ncbi:MAG: nucleotidyl transferase AbiEii/AbiGii toxin family protein, partial [Lautropia sp.]